MRNPGGEIEAPEEASGPRRVGLGLVALIASLVFLGGTIGYLIGVRTSATPASATDVGFLVDMSDHHDQGIEMALLALAQSRDPVVRGFAQDIVIFQRWELGKMSVYLGDVDATRPDFDGSRPAMEWMGMPVEARSMPGLATDDDLARLRDAEGTDFDRLFLTLMAAHHEGGVHMAEYAADHAADPRVRSLAALMARNQTIEAAEYDAHLARLTAAGAEAS